MSNDPAYTDGSLVGMYGDATVPTNPFGSQAGEAWAAGFVGSSKVAVGVLDSGVDYTHPDLYQNIWLNQGEIPGAVRAALQDIDSDGLITFRDLNAQANAAFVTDLNGQACHPPRYAALFTPPSPRFGHSSLRASIRASHEPAAAPR